MGAHRRHDAETWRLNEAKPSAPQSLRRRAGLGQHGVAAIAVAGLGQARRRAQRPSAPPTAVSPSALRHRHLHQARGAPDNDAEHRAGGQVCRVRRRVYQPRGASRVGRQQPGGGEGGGGGDDVSVDRRISYILGVCGGAVYCKGVVRRELTTRVGFRRVDQATDNPVDRSPRAHVSRPQPRISHPLSGMSVPKEGVHLPKTPFLLSLDVGWT